MNVAKTLFDKIWESHLVIDESEDNPGLLYIDLHMIHEVTSPQAFDMLREKGLKIRCQDRTKATMDHSIPTIKDVAGNRLYVDDQAKKQVEILTQNCDEFGIELFSQGDRYHGIVHIIGPELGFTQPGNTIVCGDSHTSTHGAFGALAFGIGTSEVSHVLASQTLLQRRPKTMAVNVDGVLPKGVGAKDLILAIIAKLGFGGATGYVIEYRGSAIEALTMEQRMTLCNMTIEAGGRAGMVAPDQVTFDYLEGKANSPKGKDWEKAVAKWATLYSEKDAVFDKEIALDAGVLTPMVTFGTNPSMAIPALNLVPQAENDDVLTKALDYMELQSGEPMSQAKVDIVFVGSCTNGRLSDMQETAEILKGNKVSSNVEMVIVPGSEEVKRQAEALGLDTIFKNAGAQWREPGCSMCIAMNGDQLKPGQLAVSTSNRNFEGRQGKGGKTVLASPATAAASAIAGFVTPANVLVGV